MNEFDKLTEQASAYDGLERMTTRDILISVNREDQKVAAAVGKCIPQVEKLVDGVVERMKRGGRIFYIGAGTSGRLGVLDASEIPPTFGMPPGMVVGIIAGGDRALRSSVEGAEDDREQGWKDLADFDIGVADTLVGIAASGTTPYVVGALESARSAGMLTAGITGNPGSPVARVAQIPIVPVVGPEFITGSSRMKSGTAQKMILNMISTAVMMRLGRVKGNRMVDMQLKNEKLIDRGTRMLTDELGIDYERARALLLLHGSVRAVLRTFLK